MLSEDNCDPSSKYLYADFYFSDETTKVWQDECKQRLIDKDKDENYFKFIDWKRKKNEIAVFTMYAYADFKIPKKFNCIFDLRNPEVYVNIPFKLVQSIWEGWYPIDSIEHGHKHLCIFEFENQIPPIMYNLYKETEKFSSKPKESTVLGLCNKVNLEAITKGLKNGIKGKSNQQ